MTAPNTLHTYFLLDRSGSMESIAGDVVGGFNTFVASQQADGPDAVMTLIQFDTQDPFEVLADAVSIGEVPALTRTSFQPRGGTPLLDAVGQTIGTATDRQASRKAAAEPEEEILVVIFTDGEENSSSTYSGEAIRQLIAAKEALGWTFAYLGANQDAFATGAKLGIDRGNVLNYVADTRGADMAFSDLSTNVSSKRAKMRRGAAHRGAVFMESTAAQEDFEDRA